MRQVGVIAAAARVALETGPQRLAEDHDNARFLAEGLADLNAESVDLKAVQTNMVYVNLRPFGMSSPEVAEALLKEGILTLGFPGHSMRLVTHRDVSAEQTKQALEAFQTVLRS